MSAGKVYLVGAGPGDPGLITVAGLAAIERADVIVYDRLASSRLLDDARPDTELIYAGKVPGDSHDQHAINQLLVGRAREGKSVVRLKGGDAFVFGRGGEEAEALHAAGIPFAVIPGVTSAVAVPAYAGIPVTHRGIASSFAVITGHEAEEEGGRGKKEGDSGPATALNWASLATGADTLVFLMGVKNLPEIVNKLTEHGRPPNTPVAVIQCGTTPEQRTVTGTLADITERVREAGIAPPAITVVGEVVRLRETISWFESRPLFGKRVLITRTRRQASKLAALLAQEGAIPVELPAIEIQPVTDRAVLDAAIEALRSGEYSWVGFTSANAVELFFELLAESAAGGLDARAFGGVRVFAIGLATAEALRAHGIAADVVPAEYVAEGVVEAMREHVRPGDRVLLPRAEGARAKLVTGLEGLGAHVDEVSLYRAAIPAEAPQEALAALREGRIDIVTFTSSSTVRNLMAMLGEDGRTILNGDDATDSVILSANHAGNAEEDSSRRDLGRGKQPSETDGHPVPGPRPLIACIGPITAETARELGLRVDVVASEYTVEGLVRALKDWGNQ